MFGSAIIDPPWEYNRTSDSAKLTGYADKEYDLLGEQGLSELPVADLVSDTILIWTTAPMVPQALRLVEAWGFQYVTQMFWYKASAAPDGYVPVSGVVDEPAIAYLHKPHYGVGYWVRGNTEPIILAKKKGSASVRTPERSSFLTTDLNFAESDYFITKRADHSEKPDVLHRFVENHLRGPYLEMFSRRQYKDWTCLGNEMPGQGDIRDEMQKLILGNA